MPTADLSATETARTDVKVIAAPARVQLRRLKGWRMPENTVKVCRPSVFGNPWRVQDILAADMENNRHTSLEEAQSAAVESYEAWLKGDDFSGMPPASLADRGALLRALPSLRSKNLACWCRLDQPCHADVLLEMANA
ncbi:DUF4326 domain-containing protein [Pseudoroseomonas wenyumeiae]|uniref:DUF4326 domain-containing protein n=2 Tax=Teichococcus wenyumeiae TaxID=2478470 RepID=A0ABX9VAY9_9PROT|nr:DUF4326 domain-containing protein [Pseudoroseomonas wenyumeiae]